ncbi:MAG: hypothetical protein ACKOXK_11095 [Chakrabartia sp.]
MRGGIAILGIGLAIWTAAAAAADAPRPLTELDRIMGKDARTITALLGPPAQDDLEGPARRLQFSNAACILDVYLYPPAPGQVAVATFATARVPDGRDAERNSCIAVLRSQR